MSILMDAMVRTKALLARNPVAWIPAALLIIGLYGRYTLGQSRTKLCDLIQEPLEWPAGPVASDSSIDADAEESLQDQLWRWQHANRKQIEKICAEADDGRED